MGILSTAKVATFTGPTRLALHTVEGFGKTTLAADFPSPLFVCGERGFPRDLKSAPSFVEPKTWADVRALVSELGTTQHSFQTLVFDTMDWIEPLIWRFVCERDTGRKTEMNPKGNVLESIEDYGYGKGYIAAMEEMRSFLHDLDALQSRRSMHIVILMHSHVKEFKNPAGDNFDRWQPKMHERCARLVVEWCENVFFGYFEITTQKADTSNKREKAKGASTGRRILGTRHNAMYDAKNRFNLPDTVELNDPKELIPYLLGKHIKPPVHAKAAAPAKSEHIIDRKDGDLTGGPTREKKTDAPTKGEPLTNAIREQYEKNVADQTKASGGNDQDAANELTQTDAMLRDVEAACGVKTRREVEKWLASADTPEKVNWCFAEAEKKIAAAKAKTSTPTTQEKEEKIADRYA